VVFFVIAVIIGAAVYASTLSEETNPSNSVSYYDPAQNPFTKAQETLTEMFFEKHKRKKTYVPHDRTWGFGKELVDHSLMDITADACQDFYSYSCGNYSLGKRNEFMRIAQNTNLHVLGFINHTIMKDHSHNCDLYDNSDVSGGCHAALKFYKKCVIDKYNGNGPTHLIRNLTRTMFNGSYPTTHEKIRYLATNGITNFVHLTKEATRDPDTNRRVWVHYLRPGGVLYPETTIHLDLYGDEGLKRSMKEETTLGKFSDRLRNYNKWMTIFGRHAKPDDVLYLENMQYFVNLDKMLRTTDEEEINDRLAWYVRNNLNYLFDKTCLEQTKLLFPMTFCRVFQILTMRTVYEDVFGEEVAERVYEHFVGKFGAKIEEIGLVVGSCSSLLLGTPDLGRELLKVEGDPTHMRTMHLYREGTALEWAHRHLFRRWWKFYDPVALFCTYPRTLDDELPKKDEVMDDPLDWYVQVNAFFYHFHNSAVIPPGITREPFYSMGDDVTCDYSRVGYIFGHELGHGIQDSEYMLWNCIIGSGGRKLQREKELFADVVGLSGAFEAYLTNFNDTNPCYYFLGYAQMYCAQDPDVRSLTHGSVRDRVNLPILRFGSETLVEEFNKCFGCKIKSKSCLNS
jgi:hypothetical protein